MMSRRVSLMTAIHFNVKRSFDKQDFAAAEKNARIVLQTYPQFDDVRILLARALLAQGRTADAEKEFRAVSDAKLPTARSLAWANEGLGEVALKTSRRHRQRSFLKRQSEPMPIMERHWRRGRAEIRSMLQFRSTKASKHFSRSLIKRRFREIKQI